MCKQKDNDVHHKHSFYYRIKQRLKDAIHLLNQTKTGMTFSVSTSLLFCFLISRNSTNSYKGHEEKLT